MPLPSVLKRKHETPGAAGGGADEAVEAARARARRRLIGAVVLLGVGIIGLPLLFETQPRPIPVDLPIVIPRKDRVEPLPAPAARASGAVAAEPPETAPVPPTPMAAASTPAAATAVAAPGASAAPNRGLVRSEPVAEPVAAAAAPPAASTTPDDGTRARALLDGAGAAAGATTTVAAASAGAAKAPRYVVQAGAYSDAASLREARATLERLGLKTYTQVVETPAGPRTRLRVGPFDSREEADLARAKVKGAGLAVTVLVL